MRSEADTGTDVISYVMIAQKKEKRIAKGKGKQETV